MGTVGLVVGKFLPFHLGHHALINFALKHCDKLEVLVCESNRENISGEIRKFWIDSCITDCRVYTSVMKYDEKILPNTSEQSASKSWAESLKQLYPDVTVIFTSEDYGDYVAKYMGIKHTMFDKKRLEVPVSGTKIRCQPSTYWQYLPTLVRPMYTKRISILGTESTGKSTLAKRLSEHFNCGLANEYGRQLVKNSKEVTKENLEEIIRCNLQTGCHLQDYLRILDTDIHTTMGYCRYFFPGEEFNISQSNYEGCRSNLYFYMSRESTDYVQDGTRLSEEERNNLDIIHRKVLSDCRINFIELTGSYEERFDKVVKEIEKLTNI